MKKRIVMIFSAILLLMAFRIDASEIYDKNPEISEERGYMLPMALELVPGCGFLYMTEFRKAAFFSVFKFSGIAASFYYYEKGFNGNYNNVTRDRYRENFIIASTATAALYMAAWYVLYEDIADLNRTAVPVFDVSFAGTDVFEGPVFHAGAQFRF